MACSSGGGAGRDTSGANGGGTGATGGASAGSGKGDTSQPKAAKIGQPVRDGKFEFTVQQVKCGVNKVGETAERDRSGPVLPRDDQGDEIGKEAQAFSDSNQKAYGADGSAYSTDSAAGLYANEDTNTLFTLAQRRASGWAPPRLAALLSAREAVCWAQLGDAAASRNAMHRAYHVFHPDMGEEDPHWLAFFDTAELATRRATASSYLGRPDQAANAMQSAVDGLGAKFQRNRAYYGIRLGLSLLAEGDQTRACQVVTPVLPLFKQVRSGDGRNSWQRCAPTPPRPLARSTNTGGGNPSQSPIHPTSHRWMYSSFRYKKQHA